MKLYSLIGYFIFMAFTCKFGNSVGILCSGRVNVWKGLSEAPVRNEPQPAQSLRSAQINWVDSPYIEGCNKIITRNQIVDKSLLFRKLCQHFDINNDPPRFADYFLWAPIRLPSPTSACAKLCWIASRGGYCYHYYSTKVKN